jgi:hypothetical protein
VAAPRETVVIADYDFANVDVERAIIEKAGFELTAARCKTEDEVIEIAHAAAGVVAQYATISARVIAKLHDCRVIGRYGTGVDIVDVDAATNHNILVTNVPNDWCADEVADHAIALLLAVARKINVYDRATRGGTWQWQSGAPIHRLRGSVFGLLSFGVIARAIAARAAGFGMRITVHDPYVQEEEITASGATVVSFEELVTKSDCLVIQAPLTPETHQLFDEFQLRRMKATAILDQHRPRADRRRSSPLPSTQPGLHRGRRARRHRGGAGQGQGLAAGQPVVWIGQRGHHAARRLLLGRSDRHRETLRRRRGSARPYRAASAVAGQRRRTRRRALVPRIVSAPLETIVVDVDGSQGSVSRQIVQHATSPVVVVNQPATAS